LARELHDGVGQKLMLLTKRTKSTGNAELESLAKSTLEELRNISQGLHPISIREFGFTNATISLINEVDLHTDILFTNSIEIIDDFINEDNSLHLYRIIQEILNNVVKHSDTKSCFFSISSTKKQLKVVVKDKGKGFDYVKKKKENTTLGMGTIFERCKIIKAKLAIVSELEKGTKIEIIIPKI